MSTAATAVRPKKTAQEMVRSLTSIGTLPEVTSRIIATVEDPKSSASQLNRIVSHDPALVTRILKVVNSAFYGLSGQVGSIERAIVLLGLNAVKNIAVAASLGQLFRGVSLGQFTPKDIWKHCLAVGVTARDMAARMKLPMADEAFLAGMIHDLGLLISLQTAPEILRAVCESAASHPGTSFCQLEEQLIGQDHQAMGMALAEHWRFPRSCQLVAGYHHHPADLEEADHRTLVNLIFVADTLCCQSKHGFNLTALHQPMDAATLESLQINPEVVSATRENLDKLVSSTASLLG